MGILDDLLAFDKEEDERKAAEASLGFTATGPLTPVVHEPEEDYRESHQTSDSKKASLLPPQRETILKKVGTSKLVWAKCNYFKKGNAFFPGRIAELSEAACQIDIPLTIMPENVLIEFFCLPLKNPFVPQYVQVEKVDVRPYNAALNGRRQLSLLHAFSNGKAADDNVIAEDGSEQCWSIGYDDSMREKLRAKYNGSVANTVYCKIKEKSKEFLTNAIDYKKTKASEAADRCQDDEDDETRSTGLNQKDDEEAKVDLFSLVTSTGGARRTISAGRWISYQHKIFKDKTVYVRVVEVTGKTREPVLLENDDVLRPTDVVCLLDEISDGSDEDDEPTNGGLKNVFVSGKGGYVKGSGISRQLQEYNFKISKISFTSIQEDLLNLSRKDHLAMEKEKEKEKEKKKEEEKEKGRDASTAGKRSRGDDKEPVRKGVADKGSSSSGSGSSSAGNGTGSSVRDFMTVIDSDDEDEVEDVDDRDEDDLIFVDPPQQQQKQQKPLGKNSEDAFSVSDSSDSPSPIRKRKSTGDRKY